ncbi:MAG: DUF5946 family protein [Thermomicrobiales bacterium]
MEEPIHHTPCIGCGGLVPDSDGPVHKYVVTSPGCWQLFGEVTAREYGDFKYPAVHRLTVDAYMAQHPGSAAHDRRQRQSVAVHLCGLYLAIERQVPFQQITAVLGRLTARPDWPLFPAPPSPHWLTVVDIAGAVELDDHTARVERWARSVWDAWAPHHETVRQLAAMPPR